MLTLAAYMELFTSCGLLGLQVNMNMLHVSSHSINDHDLIFFNIQPIIFSNQVS
jgi:hypothetical protein